MDGPTIPIKVLLEAVDHQVVVEILSKDTYRGTLEEAQPNMNLRMSGVTHSMRDGRTRKMDEVYLRGSQVRMVVLPEMLKNAPVFNTVNALKEKRERDVAKKAQKKRSRAAA